MVGKLCLAGVLLSLLWPAHALAQVNATIAGTVSDTTGALIPGVEVTTLNVNTGIATLRVTNETGSYQIPGLQPGTYNLTAELPGFQTSVLQGINLVQGQEVRFNFTLQVGDVATAIEVVSDSAAILATTTASVGDVLPDVEVRSLPLASRNVLDLAATTAGVVDNNFGGARMSQVNTTRDGLVVSDGRYMDLNGAYSATFTSPDLVEEVQVNVNSVDASVGRGSGQVRMQTRSGTNEFHGALFYTNNNSALSSQTWFNNLTGAQQAFQNRNQFGGRIGGPIIRNKAFFFFLYDGQRFLEKANVTSTVLTAEARQGIFRFLTANVPSGPGAIARQNGNALSTTPSVDLSGNILTQDQQGRPLFVNHINVFADLNDPNRTTIDQVWIASQYLPRMPLPNDWTVGDGLNTSGFSWLRRHEGSDDATGTSANPNRDHFTIRFDYQVNAAHKFSYTMTKENNWGVTAQTGLSAYPDGYFGEVRRKPDFYTASLSSTLSPSVLNEFRWGLKRDSWYGWSPHHLRCCYDGAGDNDILPISQEVRATFPTVPTGQMLNVNAATGMGLGAYAPLGAAAPRYSNSPLMQIANTVSWTRGAHSFQGGFEGTWANSNQSNTGGLATTMPNSTLGAGAFPVNGITATNFPGLHASNFGGVSNLLLMLSGSVGTVSHQFFINSPNHTEFLDYRDTMSFMRDFHQNDFAAFFKDSWRVTNNLTLNLGVRYDKYGTPYDANGLGARPKGGQAGLFSISGTGFDALWNPRAAAGSPTVLEFAGKHSPQPDVLIYGNDWNNVAPSVGFSWNLPGLGGSTVLRGGYGVNYTGAPTMSQYNATLASIPGAAVALSQTPATYTNIARLTTDPTIFPLDHGGIRPFEPIPFTNRTTGLTGWADERVIPYVQSFNLSFQREVARNLTLEVSYVGNKGTKLWGSTELNEINIFENGILDAFEMTRFGGTAALFDQILTPGTVLPGAPAVGTTVGGVLITGSEALRRSTTTRGWLSNGQVGSLANWINSGVVPGGVSPQPGDLLRRGNLPENFIVVNPQFGSVSLRSNPDNSIYHSMQAQLRKRMSHGFSGQFSYAWSRNIGNSLAGNQGASDTTTTMRDPRNRQLQRGLVEFHRTHVFNAHGAWELPFGPNQTLLSDVPSWMHRIVEGWDVSSIFSWRSGSPLEFTTTNATMGNRALSNTADLVGTLPTDGKVTVTDGGVVNYFGGLNVVDAPAPAGMAANLTGFHTNRIVVDGNGNIVLQNPLPGATGSTAFNLSHVEGPANLGLDLAVSKRIRVGEAASFTIRADAINALNMRQWSNPNTDINSNDFGRITDATGARTFTINARIDF